MKILFFALSFYTNKNKALIKGGMEKYIYELIAHLKSQHQVILVIPEEFDTKVDNIKIYYFKPNIAKFASLLYQFDQIIKKEKPDMVSAFIASIYSFILFLAARMHKVKTILNLRGFDINIPFMNFSASLCCLLSNCIITNAKELISQYSQTLYLPPKIFKKIQKVYIPNAIDTDFWKPEPAEVKYDISFVANLHNMDRILKKGFIPFYKALLIIESKYKTKLRVILVGDLDLKAMRKRFPNFDPLFFDLKGQVMDERDIKKYVCQSKIFVLSSNVEGMPNALMEALALEKASISTNVGSVSEILTDGVNGLIIPPNQPNILAEKIWILLHNKALIETLSKNGRKSLSEKFDWTRNVQSVLFYYNKILSLH
jgi:glycosyltransferase involved in cell wall biosynthesis